jgi:hypothetical protein
VGGCSAGKSSLERALLRTDRNWVVIDDDEVSYGVVLKALQQRFPSFVVDSYCRLMKLTQDRTLACDVVPRHEIEATFDRIILETAVGSGQKAQTF